MILEEAIYERLTSDAGVSALVGTRVYPHVVPQSTPRPYLTYSRIAVRYFHDHNAPAGIKRTRLQFDILGDRVLDVRGVADAVRQALDGLKGDLAPGYPVQSCLRLSDFGTKNYDLDIYRTTIDYLIFHGGE